jgi:hypothetical protein
MNSRSHSLAVFLLLSFFASFGISSLSERALGQSKFSAKTETVRGLRQTTFSAPEGELHVSLSEGTRAGATLRGRVFMEPKGKTEKEREKNLAKLNRYDLAVERGKTDKPFPMTVEDVFTIAGPATATSNEKFYTWKVGAPKGPNNTPISAEQLRQCRSPARRR